MNLYILREYERQDAQIENDERERQHKQTAKKMMSMFSTAKAEKNGNRKATA
jgi:hypothetical protein